MTRTKGVADIAVGSLAAAGSVGTGAGLCVASVGVGCVAGAGVAAVGSGFGVNQVVAGVQTAFGPYQSTEGAKVLASFDPNQPENRSPLVQDAIDLGVLGLEAGFVKGVSQIAKGVGKAIDKAGGVGNIGEPVGGVSESAKYILNAERVRSGLKLDASHRAASFLSKEQLEAGRTFVLRGGDGIERTLLQTPGGLNGKNGIFEYIYDSAGKVTHQRFIEGGTITGLPNQRIPPGP